MKYAPIPTPIFRSDPRTEKLPVEVAGNPVSIGDMMTRFLTLFVAIMLAFSTITPASAQEPLRLTLRDGVIEALPFALPTFQAEVGGSEGIAADISRGITEDLNLSLISL